MLYQEVRLNNMEEKRCAQCGKIIVGDSKLGLCPKCADKDARGVAEAGVGLLVLAGIVKVAWKPTKAVIKAVANAVKNIKL